jgi:hypothetical protein
VLACLTKIREVGAGPPPRYEWRAVVSGTESQSLRLYSPRSWVSCWASSR